MFYCDICNYETRDRSNYAKHKNSKKHIQNQTTDDMLLLNNKNVNHFVTQNVTQRMTKVPHKINC